MYVNLTTKVGIIRDVGKESGDKGKHQGEKDKGEQDNGEQDNGEQEDDKGDLDSSDAGEPKVMSTGRQRFGDTRTMQYFKLDHPMLVQYMR